MRLKHFTLIKFLFAAAWAPIICAAQIELGSTSQISLSTSGIAPQGGMSGLPTLGPNGRYLVFESNAFNLVASDTNGTTDIFVRDLTKGTITLGSINSSDTQATGQSNHASVSRVLPDGFYAYAFESDGQNLTTIPNLSIFRNIYVRIPSLGITEIVSPATGFTAPSGDSTNPSIAVIEKSDGERKLAIAFSSDAPNLTVGDNNGARDIFLSGVTVPESSAYTPSTFSETLRIPTSVISGNEPNGPSSNPKISADGRFVVFESRASNLVTGISDSSTTQHIYRYNTQTGETILVSKASDGTPGDNDSANPVISYNGNYIAYETSAENIVPVAPSGGPFGGIIRFDADDSESVQVNVTSAGAQGTGQGLNPSISANGRLVAFTDDASDLVANDLNDAADVFVRDMEMEELVRVSVGPNGAEASSSSSRPTLASASLNGLSSSVAFMSTADNLTEVQTSSGNGDVYLNSLILDPPALSSESELEVPPDVTVKAKKIKFTAQKFTAAPDSGAATIQVRYDFRITARTRVNGVRRTTRSNVIQKRNTITVAKTKGRYTVKNRVLGINSTTGKTVIRTEFTPRQTFTVE